MGQYRIAVLKCDTPPQSIVDKFGDYGVLYETYLRRSLASYVEHGGAKKPDDVQITAVDAVGMEELPALDAVDCLMLTGSKHDAFADDEWIVRLVEYIRKAYQTAPKVSLVGICFGHQIIARALGGEVKRSNGLWEVSVDKIKLKPLGKEIFGVDELSLHQMHQDIVSTLPEDAQNLGDSPSCAIQGMYVPGRAISIQAHPEFNDGIMETLLTMRHDQGRFTDHLFASGMKRAREQHDGMLVGRAFWKFLLGEL